MLEITGNLWDYYDKGYTICITTNGTIKKDGSVVMGRGCALEAKNRFPLLPKKLGECLTFDYKTDVYNVPFYFIEYNIVTFPVKDNWYETAKLDLIYHSCVWLKHILDTHDIKKIVLPRPGCGNGKLDWEKEVKPVIKDILDDRILIISKGE